MTPGDLNDLNELNQSISCQADWTAVDFMNVCLEKMRDNNFFIGASNKNYSQPDK